MGVRGSPRPFFSLHVASKCPAKKSSAEVAIEDVDHLGVLDLVRVRVRVRV